MRHRAGRHFASCVFVVKKEHSDFLADNSVFHDMLQLVMASRPCCSLAVALYKSVSCTHTGEETDLRGFNHQCQVVYVEKE